MANMSVLESRTSNRRWIGEHMGYLSKGYAYKYIAVFEKKVIASGDSISDIHDMLNGQPKNAVTIIYVSDTSEGWII